MKRLILAALFTLLAGSAQAATCSATTPQLKDNTGTTFTAPYADDGTGSGACRPQIGLQDGADTTLGAKADAAWSSGSGSVIALLKAAVNGINGAIAAGTNVIGGIFGSPNVTPTDCSIALTTGGSAQNIISAASTVHGFTIANIDTSAGSGEPVWISFTTTAAASTIGSYPLAAPTATTFANLSSYTTPLGFGSNHAVSVIAATTGHKISCTQW